MKTTLPVTISGVVVGQAEISEHGWLYMHLRPTDEIRELVVRAEVGLCRGVSLSPDNVPARPGTE